MKLRKLAEYNTIRPTKFNAILNSNFNESWQYIEINLDVNSAKFKIERCDGVASEIVIVSPSALENIANETEVNYKKCTQLEFYIYKIKRDPVQFNAFIGIMLVSIATLIDGSFLIAKTGFVLLELASSVISVLTVASMLMKIAGAVLIFWKGLLTDK